MIGSILTGLAAIPTIIGFVESFAAAVSLWYVQRQTTKTLSMIADAAALAGRASTDGERYAAAQAWKIALSQPRITSN